MPTKTVRSSLSREQLFCLRGCGSQEQYNVMRKGFEEGRCVFCSLDRSFNKIEHENDHWMLWQVPQQFLKKHTALHILIVPKRHIRFPWDLTPLEHKAVAEMWGFVGIHYGKHVPGGIVATRIGDMSYNAGTVPHYHMNLQVPTCKDELRIPVFKRDDDAEKNEARMAEFAHVYESTIQ